MGGHRGIPSLAVRNRTLLGGVTTLGAAAGRATDAPTGRATVTTVHGPLRVVVWYG